jgi:hypothetical protein
VHHRTIQINHQPDATVFQFIILSLFTAQHVSGVLPPIIRNSKNAVAAYVFTFEGKTRVCHCSHSTPDDGLKNARNMLRCK